MKVFKKLSRSTQFTIIVFVSLTLAKFFLHYLEFGFIEFILFDLYFSLILFLIGWVILMSKLFYRRLSYSIVADFLIIGITYCVIHFAMNVKSLDSLDWKINYSKRKKIVRLIKEERSFTSAQTTYQIPFSLTLFPYFKSNTVYVECQQDSIVTVTFFTDRGILDHYSAFIYSNDSAEIKRLDEKVKTGGNEYKKETGWYFIHD